MQLIVSCYQLVPDVLRSVAAPERGMVGSVAPQTTDRSPFVMTTRSAALKHQRRVCAAESEAVRHHCVDAPPPRRL